MENLWIGAILLLVATLLYRRLTGNACDKCGRCAAARTKRGK
jgi:hypothetical protein